MYAIRRLLRGAFLVLAVATGSTMLAATPSQAVPSSGGCGTTEGWDDDGSYECGYCEVFDSGYCVFVCTNGATGGFACDEF